LLNKNLISSFLAKYNANITAMSKQFVFLIKKHIFGNSLTKDSSYLRRHKA